MNHLVAAVVHILVHSDISRLCWTLTVDHNDYQAPIFVQEPVSKMTFINDSGAHVSCSAHGVPSPLVTWVLKDGTDVASVPGLRQTPGNGSLYFPPFAGQYFRADVHDGIYRCKASNPAGTVLSRDVFLQAVVRKPFDVRVDGKDVVLGNVAFLRCTIPEPLRDFVHVTSWYRGDEMLLPEQADVGGRYAVISGSGSLHIRSVRSEDGVTKFSCLTVNGLSGERRMSDAVYLSVKEITSNMAPRTNQKPATDMFVDRGNDIHLPCNIQGNPLPVFTWFRVSDSNALYPVPSSQRIMPYQTLLLIKNADERDSGKWVCKASNQFGDQRIEVRLHVNTYLSVHIHPQVQIVNSGGSAVFNCSITGSGVEMIEWYHDGVPINGADQPQARGNKVRLLSPVSLLISDVGRSDRGIYQCLVTNKKSSAQAMAELKLGDIVPELIYTFIEQNVRPGPHISLKCSAAGSPPPQFTWLLDSQPIMDVSSQHRYAIGQFVDASGDVISHLNISHVRTDDGGLYKCVATNAMGGVEHSARLNVYGPPYVRATGPIRAVAGETYLMHCPFSGYPIESVQWEKSRQELSSNSRYEVTTPSQGGYLKVYNVDSNQDTGIYTCIVRSRAGEEARRDMQLTVNSPPVIEPFSFPKNLQEGGRAQVTCQVSSGDMPVYFSWFKDGAPIPMSLQITEKKDEFFTLLVFKDISARHSGQYTCYATNSAAKVNFTSELLVRVPPRWISEPKDTALMLGNTIAIHCIAEGYPEPSVTWLKSQDKSTKEFKSMPLRNNSLLVDFATEADEGYYMCQVSNGIGTELKKIIYINVNEPARFEQSMTNVSSKRNDPVTLSCLAKGDDPINILWSHNNARIDLNNYRLNIAEMKSSDGVNSQLSMSRSDRHDSGQYKCLAENPFGKSEHTIYLAVQERPDTPSNLEIVEAHSRSVKLSWRRPFDGNSPVLSYVVQYQPLRNVHSAYNAQHPSSSGGASSSSGPSSIDGGGFEAATSVDEWISHTKVNVTLPTISGVKSLDGNPREQATLAGLHPSTTYIVRMLAVNEIERSAFTEPVVIKTREEAPTEPPISIQVHTGTSIGELIVVWQPPPKDSWNGDLMGYTINCTEERQNINYIGSNETVRKTVRVDGFATTKTTVKQLKTYRRYAIAVRAVNSFGPGPWSATAFGTTLEGVPEAPPQGLNCSALSSQSIKIAWAEPPLPFHGGIILGYKIVYRPLVKELDITSSNEVKRTSNLETYLHSLYKATNYSIRVLAYTTAGEGVSSNPVYCCTEDDLPEPPANIKAAALTADSILISWMAPKLKNGAIQHYTAYSREAGKKGQAKSNLVRVDENGNPRLFEARGMNENQMYEFWVSASTSIGEGEPTNVVMQATNTRAPARIASFSQTVRKPVGTTLVLPCHAVGNPTPRARWFTRDRPITFSPFYDVAADGSLKIHSLEQSLSGNYTCSAKNLFGEDAVVYRVIAMKPPNPPQISVNYAAIDSIRISWEATDDGGTPIQGYVLQHRNVAGDWIRVDLTAELTAYTVSGLKCGSQYLLKIAAMNGVGDGQTSEEFIVWTKGKKPIEPDVMELIQSNATCINLNLSSWSNGGCAISHFSIEHRPLGDIRWTVVSSDISNSEENRESLVFCDFLPATWYQLKMSASNDAGRALATFNFATTNMAGERIAVPEVFPAGEEPVDISNHLLVEQSDWILACIVAVIVLAAGFLVCVILKHRGVLCGPISEGYESRTIQVDHKDSHENRRNQQVYSASPVKTIDKCNEAEEMYEISPYATFSVSGGRTHVGPGGHQAKTPTRGGVTTSTLDYTVQFKTFGHPDGENLNATAYPVLPAGGAGGGGGGGGGGNSGFGHVKGKSSWHKQRYINTDDDSTLSKSMTIMVGSAQHQHQQRGGGGGKHHRSESAANRSQSRNDIHQPGGSESDTSASPINEFSNTPTYRVPTKSSRDLFRPDSSTESNNDNSPVERRTSTPRHVVPHDQRPRVRPVKPPRESQSMELGRAGSNNSLAGDVLHLAAAGQRFQPPTGFLDSREFSEAECDRERALDLEVQSVMANSAGDAKKIDREELATLLARYQEKKEMERLEYIIHV